MFIIDIAKICHQANKALCESHGDLTQPNWEDAPEWQRQSAVDGVTAHVKSNLTMKPSDSHESWMKQKLADGWVYGPVKDAEKKTHPCIMPYHCLPEHQKQKDYLFTAIVHALA